MSLIKEFQDRASRFKESKRQIERGKRLVHIGKITLLGEFYDYAIKPLMANMNSPIADAFRKKEDEQRRLLKLWIAAEGIETFPVPKTLLEKDCPEYSYASLFGAEVGYIANITGKMEKLGQGTDDYASNALKNHDRWLRRQETYPAVHLGHPLIAMGWGLEQKLELVEWVALAFDDGQTVSDFWNDVNNLRDYSRHFPDRLPFTGKKPPPKQQRVRVPLAVGAGWNPVPTEI
jgi:hypothetical protein